MPSRPLLLLVVLLGLPSAAFQLRKDSQGDVVRWPGRVTFVVDSRLAEVLGESAAEVAVRAAVAAMQAATPACDIEVRVGKGKALGYQVGSAENQNDVMALEDWPYDANALAATVVTLDARTNEILDADIVFNAENFHFQVVDVQRGSALRSTGRIDDIQNTLTHELGHALGLQHNETDPTVVMYPSAGPMEISKRVLAPDDTAGLMALYGSVSLLPTGGFGCASTAPGSGMGAALALAVAVLLAQRRRAALAVSAVVLSPLAVLASDPSGRTSLDLAVAEEVGVAEVTATRSARSEQNPQLIFTEVALASRECVRGPCAAVRVLRVPGGRVGDIEQVVAHEPVPALHEHVLLVAGPRRPRLFRATEAWQRAALAEAFARAQLAFPVSLAPRASGDAPSAAAEPAGFAR